MVLGYIIYEIQSDGEGHNTHLPPVDKTDANEAWGEFYLKLAYAATSTVPIHTVMLVTVDGRMIQSKTFLHREVKPNEE